MKYSTTDPRITKADNTAANHHAIEDVTTDSDEETIHVEELNSESTYSPTSEFVNLGSFNTATVTPTFQEAPKFYQPTWNYPAHNYMENSNVDAYQFFKAAKSLRDDILTLKQSQEDIADAIINSQEDLDKRIADNQKILVLHLKREAAAQLSAHVNHAYDEMFQSMLEKVEIITSNTNSNDESAVGSNCTAKFNGRECEERVPQEGNLFDVE